jgi:hypothetical protein
MNESMLKAVKEITLKSVKSCKTFNEICVNVRKSVIEKFGSHWHCFAYKLTYGSFSLDQLNGKYAQLSISDFHFLIFESI